MVWQQVIWQQVGGYDFITLGTLRVLESQVRGFEVIAAQATSKAPGGDPSRSNRGGK